MSCLRLRPLTSRGSSTSTPSSWESAWTKSSWFSKWDLPIHIFSISWSVNSSDLRVSGYFRIFCSCSTKAWQWWRCLTKQESMSICSSSSSTRSSMGNDLAQQITKKTYSAFHVVFTLDYFYILDKIVILVVTLVFLILIYLPQFSIGLWLLVVSYDAYLTPANSVYFFLLPTMALVYLNNRLSPNFPRDFFHSVLISVKIDLL